jgi:hypothetical protein
MTIDIRYQYINSFQIKYFFSNIIKIHSFTSLTGVGGGGEGALQGNFGRYRCAAEIAKTTQHSQKSWVILLMNIHKPNRVIYDVSK